MEDSAFQTKQMKKLVSSLVKEHVEKWFADTLEESLEEKVKGIVKTAIENEFIPAIETEVREYLKEAKGIVIQELRKKIRDRDFLKESVDRLMRGY